MLMRLMVDLLLQKLSHPIRPAKGQIYFQSGKNILIFAQISSFSHISSYDLLGFVQIRHRSGEFFSNPTKIWYFLLRSGGFSSISAKIWCYFAQI